jgi:hypothetical protein
MEMSLVKELFGYAWADFESFLNAREMCGDNTNPESDYVFEIMTAMLDDVTS